MNDATHTETVSSSHPFELAGLGRAPFRFVGMVKQDICYGEAVVHLVATPFESSRDGIMITTKPGGACAFCGTYIRNMYGVESADGKRFHVGCDCIAKVNSKTIKGFDAAKRAMDRAARAAKAKAVSASIPGAILANRRALRSRPSPNAYRAAKGETLLSWCLWMARNAGATGRAKIVRAIKLAA